MKKHTGIGVVIFLLAFSALADTLELTLEQTSIKLPYWVAKKPHYGAVILVRGGEHPKWSRLLAHFAKQLSQYGWSTVLLNCKEANNIPWITQLPSAISELRQANNKRIIMMHYGDQLNQSLEYFNKPQAKMINGLIMLSAYDDQKLDSGLRTFRFPLFDIGGQFDYGRVHQQMKDRSKKFRRPNYLAVEMPGAGHDYQYSQKLLLAYVHGWMTKLPEIKPQPAPIVSSYIEPVVFFVSSIASIDGFHTTSLLTRK